VTWQIQWKYWSSYKVHQIQHFLEEEQHYKKAIRMELKKYSIILGKLTNTNQIFGYG
jgi:hypothetical protein